MERGNASMDRKDDLTGKENSEYTDPMTFGHPTDDEIAEPASNVVPKVTIETRKPCFEISNRKAPPVDDCVVGSLRRHENDLANIGTYTWIVRQNHPNQNLQYFVSIMMVQPNSLSENHHQLTLLFIVMTMPLPTKVTSWDQAWYMKCSNRSASKSMN